MGPQNCCMAAFAKPLTNDVKWLPDMSSIVTIDVEVEVAATLVFKQVP